MKSRIGRASWIADCTVGHRDPARRLFYLMLKAAAEYPGMRPARQAATEENR